MICETCQGKATVIANIHDRTLTIPCYDCANRTLARWKEERTGDAEREALASFSDSRASQQSAPNAKGNIA